MKSLTENNLYAFLRKEKRERVFFELAKDRKNIIRKFATIDRYFRITDKTINLTKNNSSQIWSILQQELGCDKEVYILSTSTPYDQKNLILNQEILEEILYDGFPSVILLNEKVAFVVGELEYTPPKYLLKI